MERERERERERREEGQGGGSEREQQGEGGRERVPGGGLGRAEGWRASSRPAPQQSWELKAVGQQQNFARFASCDRKGNISLFQMGSTPFESFVYAPPLDGV